MLIQKFSTPAIRSRAPWVDDDEDLYAGREKQDRDFKWIDLEPGKYRMPHINWEIWQVDLLCANIPVTGVCFCVYTLAVLLFSARH